LPVRRDSRANPHGQPAGCSVPKPLGVERPSELVLGFRAGLNQPRRKLAGQAADRNKCTLQDKPSSYEKGPAYGGGPTFTPPSVTDARLGSPPRGTAVPGRSYGTLP
jgi:hypothetical protein